MQLYRGPSSLIRSADADGECCEVSPHVGQPRCALVADMPSFKTWRCDKPSGHRGFCLSYERTMLGLDTGSFLVFQQAESIQFRTRSAVSPATAQTASSDVTEKVAAGRANAGSAVA